MADPIPSRAWHYTDGTGLVGMTSSHTIWATSPVSLNDVTELQYGLDVIESVWNGIRHLHPPGVDGAGNSVGGDSLDRIFGGGFEVYPSVSVLTYFLSASKHPDDLGQWRGYAGAQGYAVGLDTAVPLIDPGESDPYAAARPGDWLPVNGWYEVIYNEEIQRERAREVLEQAIALPAAGRLLRVTQAQQLIGGLAAIMKHPGFEPEAELRYVHSTHGGVAHYRSGRYGITPYVELSTARKKLPIQSVVCGPTGHNSNNVTEGILQRLLTTGGYHEATTQSSAIPFRP